MARPIDADALMEKQCARLRDGDVLYRIPPSAIDNAPTLDAVEVVRCMNCNHWSHREDGYGDCSHPRFHLEGHPDPTMTANDFCSCGERRTK